MDNIAKTSNKINELYTNLSYFDQYGGSVVLFILLLIVLFVVMSYATIMKNIQPIKDDWPNQRCKPQVIPFAGLINKPANSTIVEFTGENFAYCTQNILTSITGYALQPISYLTYSLRELFEAISEAMQYIRVLLTSIRTNMTSMAQETLGRIANIMVPIQQIIIAFKDAMGKVKGVLTAGLYTSLGSYYALKAMLGAIAQLIITILIVMVALIIAMWILPFTWPVAITMTAIFISITIPLAIIIAFMTDVLHVRTSFSIPGVPSRPAVCFDKYTLLKMDDGSYKTIMDVNVGDFLFGGNMVTAKMKLDASGQKMYNISGTIVSGSHRVLNNKKWILACEHPNRIPIENYEEPFLYCLNTSEKRIKINEELYMDWDELFQTDICDILNKSKSKAKTLSGIKNTIYLHSLFDGGLSPETDITMNDGSIKNIKNIEVGDVLEKNIKVLGVVLINGDTLFNQYQYILGEGEGEGEDKGVCFEGGPNLSFGKKNLERIMTKMSPKPFKTLYHLITEEKYFYIGDIQILHYDSNIELLLDRYRGNYYL